MDRETRRRLFLALWPEEAVRERIATHPVDSGRLVPRQNWHVTLLFLGAVEAARQRSLEAGIDTLRESGFRLLLDRRGHWRRSGVTWLGASSSPPALDALHRRLRKLVAAQELPVENRPYSAHLTLARRAQPEPTTAIDPIGWEVDRFCLMESIASPSGVRYEVLRRWPLAATPAVGA